MFSHKMSCRPAHGLEATLMVITGKYGNTCVWGRPKSKTKGDGDCACMSGVFYSEITKYAQLSSALAPTC